MLVKIHARGLSLSENLKRYTESKIRMALGIYGDRIKRADIFLKDINGPRGGMDMDCKITIRPDGQPAITVQKTTADMYDAINVCSQKIKRAARRRFDRLLQKRTYRVENDVSEQLSQ
ncbi:MAG: hypothetical protein AseanaTS_07390 [Candidatus Pelagadaptatus aseana]|uniref:HPF/RaiA family ribosome-associated protein n=1 Tax=Candidatus Pelagadaptatus aseana TaxID=3120508 RepID=UPI0039B169A6